MSEILSSVEEMRADFDRTGTLAPMYARELFARLAMAPCRTHGEHNDRTKELRARLAQLEEALRGMETWSGELLRERDFLADRVIGQWRGWAFYDWRDEVGISSMRLVARALGEDDSEDRRCAPRDQRDLARCERTFAKMPPHMKRRVRPLLEEWRAALNEEEK